MKTHCLPCFSKTKDYLPNLNRIFSKKALVFSKLSKILHHYLSNSRINPVSLFSGIWNHFSRTGKMVKRQAKP
jgi:hypothetical protein